MAILKVDTISGIGTEGPVFEGDIEFTSQNFLTLPKGDTTQRGRGRAVIFAGYVSSPGATTEEIVYFDIATSGTSLRFGDLGITQGATGGAVASSTRAVYGGGVNPGNTNLMEYVKIMTTGNASDFGDLTQARHHLDACSNGHGGLG